MSAREKIAYIKGLLDAGTPRDDFEMALYGAIVEALDAVVDDMDRQDESLVALTEELMDLSDYCDGLGEDLDAIEEGWLGDRVLGQEDILTAEEDEPEGVDLYRPILCPYCSTMFYYRPDLCDENDTVQCPNCRRTFAPSEVELEEE
ncbi:hypothetical protein L2W58_01055 [Dethiosulfovibrio sp. F2B]|uniref:CD1247 N-terminal domain-containing protein n=1 Tax=Dethiosulfovibrio faecalis TaxID=2720018 RepID=UPI001F15B845|nr:CD1247 N-terminal domain-containing protein [Dethiosulfovibrio faecalis]MCF4150394.1 hypothetical protein [Dethiosulfovibrio faecalis]